MSIVQRARPVPKRSFANVGARAGQVQMIWASRSTLNDISIESDLTSQNLGLIGPDDFMQKAHIMVL